MNGYMSSKYGEVIIDSDVIAVYAGSVAVECFGIVGMAAISMKDGLVKLLRKDSLKHGISVVIENNEITLTFHTIISFGASIPAIAENLLGNVKYKVEAFTGLKVKHINLIVEGVKVID